MFYLQRITETTGHAYQLNDLLSYHYRLEKGHHLWALVVLQKVKDATIELGIFRVARIPIPYAGRKPSPWCVCAVFTGHFWL